MRVRRVIYQDRDRNDRLLFTPLLHLYIEDAPHRRMHIDIIAQFREILRRALLAADILLPLQEPFDLDVTWINPTSTDLGNSYLALEQAFDKYAPRGQNIGLCTDDSLIQEVRMRKMYINAKGEGARPAAILAVA